MRVRVYATLRDLLGVSAMDLDISQPTDVRHVLRLAVIVMDQGRIIEEGKHDALTARGGHYAGLYNTYFRHHTSRWRTSRASSATAYRRG